MNATSLPGRIDGPPIQRRPTILRRVRRVSASPLCAFAGIAWGGVVAGHVLAYAIAYPRPGMRHEQLAMSGHGSFHTVMLIAVLASGLGLATAGVRSLHERSRPTARPAALILATIQVPAYGLMELAERGFSLPSFVSDPAVILGLFLQVALALVLSRLLRTVACVVLAITRKRQRSARTAIPVLRHESAVRPKASELILFRPLRAPPEPTAA